MSENMRKIWSIGQSVTFEYKCKSLVVHIFFNSFPEKFLVLQLSGVQRLADFAQLSLAVFPLKVMFIQTWS